MSEADNTARSMARDAAKAARIAHERANNAYNLANTAAGAAKKAHKRADSAYEYAEKNEKRVIKLEGIVRDLLNQVINLQQNVVRGMESVRSEVVSVRNETTKATHAMIRNTGAIGKMEALRLYNEAEAPLRAYRAQIDQVDSLREDTERNVSKVVGKYDQMLSDIVDVNKTNHHRIGAHIYRIVDEDFTPLNRQAQSRSTIQQFQQGNMELDAHRIVRRTEQLDNNLSTFHEEELIPRVKALNIFEGKMTERFGQPSVDHTGDIYIPTLAVYTCDTDKWELHNNVSLVEEEEFDGVSFELHSDKAYREVKNRVRAHLPSTIKTITRTELGDAELEDVKAELVRLKEEGLITPEILKGYIDYIDNFGIETF